jgi:hypothetical protein
MARARFIHAGPSSLRIVIIEKQKLRQAPAIGERARGGIPAPD